MFRERTKLGIYLFIASCTTFLFDAYQIFLSVEMFFILDAGAAVPLCNSTSSARHLVRGITTSMERTDSIHDVLYETGLTWLTNDTILTVFLATLM